MIEYLDLDDVLMLAVEMFGDPPPVRDAGLLASAVARPMATAFGQDAYPDLWTKAAALLQSVVVNHALVDGNKRLGWVATVTFLGLNGISTSLRSLDDAETLVLSVARGSTEVEDIATDLRRVLG